MEDYLSYVFCVDAGMEDYVSFWFVLMLVSALTSTHYLCCMYYLLFMLVVSLSYFVRGDISFDVG